MYWFEPGSRFECRFTDQERTTVATLIDALFYDLSPEGEVRISKQVKRRERELPI